MSTIKVAVRQPSKQLKEKWQLIRMEAMRPLLDEAAALFDAKQVNLRLNVSNTVEKLPVFIDWIGLDKVFSALIENSGVPGEKDWGLYRLGDGLISNVYVNTLQNVLKEVEERQWTDQLVKKEKKTESQLLVQKAGLKYQKFVGIVAGPKGKERCVGTLTVSFTDKPDPATNTAIDEQMKKWASWPPNPKSNLVTKIEEHFVLGGPFIS